ncbi:MAG: phosphoribosylglycinamide formyltransferase [Bacteroidota bacterium]
MKEMVLLASGSGSNVENIIKHFEGHKYIKVSCVLTNRPDAPVLERCKRLGVPAMYFDRNAFSRSNVLLGLLKSLNPALIVLAGFLWKIPEQLIRAFPNQIINIHPALLPKYGGKGMYGNAVHQAVKNNEEEETGITIHYVDEHYDEGTIIQQEKVLLNSLDSPETIAQKVHALEYEHFPKVIEKLLLNNG